MLKVEIWGEADEVQEFLGMDCWPVGDLYDDEGDEGGGDEDTVEDSQPATLPFPGTAEPEIGARLVFPFKEFLQFHPRDFAAAGDALGLGRLMPRARDSGVPWEVIIPIIVQLVLAWLASRQKPAPVA